MLNKILNILYKNKSKNIKILRIKNSYAKILIIITKSSKKKNIKICKSIKYQNFIKYLKISDIESDWTVIDIGDIVIHIMSEEYRSLYNLEELYMYEKKS